MTNLYICSEAGILMKCHTCPHGGPHEEIEIGSGLCTEDGPCGNDDIVRCVPATAERIAQALQDFQNLE